MSLVYSAQMCTTHVRQRDHIQFSKSSRVQRVQRKYLLTLWMDSWPREVMFIFSWVTVSKTAAIDHCRTQNNDGSKRKECRAAIETAVPGAMRQAAINHRLWEPRLVVLSMLFVLLYINSCVLLLLIVLATSKPYGCVASSMPHLGWILLCREPRTSCLATLTWRWIWPVVIIICNKYKFKILIYVG